MCGIYEIRNIKNGKAYVGQSTNIKARWGEHIRSARNESDSCVIHRAIRKYGVESFEFSILQECENDQETLDSLESFYIKYLNTMIPSGYNVKAGGSHGGVRGTLNSNSKLTEEMVFDIRERYAQLDKKDAVYKDYSDVISVNTFADVWIGKTWKHVHMDVYTDEIKENRKHMKYATEHLCVITKDDAAFIRDCKNMGMCKGMVRDKFFPDVNYNTFSDAWYGNTYKDVISSIEPRQVSVEENYKQRSGCNNHLSCFTEEQVRDILTRKMDGESIRIVHRDYKNISRHALSNLWYGRTYKELYSRFVTTTPDECKEVLRRLAPEEAHGIS